MKIYRVTKWTALTLVCVSMQQAVGGLQAVWDFETIQRGTVSTEKVGPGDAAWNGFKHISNPSASDYADA